MPPLIVSDDHEKKVLSLEDFFLGEKYTIINQSEVLEFPNFKFSITIAVKEKEGFVEIRFVNEPQSIGNIKFDIERTKYAGLVDGDVAQIRSVFIEPKFRTYKLATNAYSELCNFFNVVSDNLQTCDGAALWKYSIPQLDNIDVKLIQNSLDEPVYILDSDGGQPVNYNGGKFEYEKIIWSAENGNALDLAQNQAMINCAFGIINRDVVLIAIKRHQPLH